MKISSIIKMEIAERGIANVIISGANCSGKSKLTYMLEKKLSQDYTISVIRQDDYAKDIEEIVQMQEGFFTDSIHSFHIHEFKNDVKEMLSYGKTLVPRYDSYSNKRIAKDISVSRGKINIFEGLHTIKLLSGIENSISIFVFTPLDVCLERYVIRDVSDYGMPEERSRENFNDCIMPMYYCYVAPQMENATIVLEERDFE